MIKEIQAEDVKAVLKFIVAGYLFDLLDKNFDNNQLENDYNISENDKNLLKMVANGMNNEEIAWKMRAPVTVVCTKVDEIFKKLENKNRKKDGFFALNNHKFAI